MRFRALDKRERKRAKSDRDIYPPHTRGDVTDHITGIEGRVWIRPTRVGM